MHKLTNKIAIGCLVQFYEIDIIKDYLLSVQKALTKIENKENVIIDICFNLNQGLEQVDEKKITIGELRDNFREILKSVFGYDHHYADAQNYTINLVEHDNNGGGTIEEIYTIADYRREFNEKYCEEVM